MLGLCPLIAVLGARRPGAGAWNWFVVLPLIAVLLWPVTLLALQGRRRECDRRAAIRRLCPGAGDGLRDYLGTRYWLPAGLYLTGEFLLAAPMTEWGDSAPGGARFRMIAIACWSAAVLLAWLIARRRPLISDRFDRVWFDFRSAYGLAWGLRAQRRLIERGEAEGWSARLQSNGWEWDPAASDERRAETEEQIEHALRWLLRRFVDDGWLDERLKSGESQPAAQKPGF